VEGEKHACFCRRAGSHGVSAHQVATSFTSATSGHRHSGHTLRRPSHVFRHAEWKLCLHDNEPIRSPSRRGMRQIEQIAESLTSTDASEGSVVSVSLSFSNLSTGGVGATTFEASSMGPSVRYTVVRRETCKRAAGGAASTAAAPPPPLLARS